MHSEIVLQQVCPPLLLSTSFFSCMRLQTRSNGISHHYYRTTEHLSEKNLVLCLLTLHSYANIEITLLVFESNHESAGVIYFWQVPQCLSACFDQKHAQVYHISLRYAWVIGALSNQTSNVDQFLGYSGNKKQTLSPRWQSSDLILSSHRNKHCTLT